MDAELLLAHCLDQPREYLYTYPEFKPEAAVCSAFEDMLTRREQGEPIAYLLGKRAFWDFEVSVNPSVLIPRPETELLVETGLALLDPETPAKIADLGTGSGIIAIALARGSAQWRVVAVDLSDAALALARQNAARLSIDNIQWQQASWCEQLDEEAFDLITANPPYVAPGDPHLSQGDLRYEPSIALQSDQSGYSDLFAIADRARDNLRPGGWLLMEHGENQHQTLCGKLDELGYTEVTGRKDLSGCWRMVQAQKPTH